MERIEGYDPLELLTHIDPARLDYSEWVSVGMALKDAGCSCRSWDDWSRGDPARYHTGECAKKWLSFNGSQRPVTTGTLYQLATDQGFSPTTSGHELDWNDSIGADEMVVINPAWVEGVEVVEPDDWDPVKQLVTYLETLFEAGDNVGYVTRSWESEGRFLPTRGCWDRTAGQLIEQLSKCNGDIGRVIGDYTPEAGAWIRFNPLDGKGVKNDNVTDYRYALVESDDMDIDRQNAVIRELELPVACLVHSGKKSLHAIVRIDAASYDEYRKRVDFLYEICRKNGLAIDNQNRNPSRLSRMPGVLRNGRKQYLIDTNIGKPGWNEWREWIESVNDDLPEPESMAKAWNDLPELSPPLIQGVLRQGHKLLLAGPSKAGKSYALIQLCCAIAEGKSWLGFDCAQGRVMYVNLELDRASCLHRFVDVYGALGWRPENLKNIDVWNLRGKSVPMDKLAPKLIRRAVKKDYIAIIIDPIYKVITGDENSADQMAHFCNQFDRVCTELGCAVIYCHHHSKGGQGQKRSMDRASGSGVFARDPDALLDLIELDLTDALRKQEVNNAICAACAKFLADHGWEDEASQDDACSQSVMLKICEGLISGNVYETLLRSELNASVEGAKAVASRRTAWRIEGTLREFERFPPVNLWFNYPIHSLDADGTLSDIAPEVETPPWKKAVDSHKKSAKDRKGDRKKALELAIETSNFGETPTVKDVADYLGISERTARDRIKEHGGYSYQSGKVIKRTAGEPEKTASPE